MTAPELTLNQVKKSEKVTTRTARVSDFLSNEKRIELRMAQEARSAEKRRGFDEIDAYSAEILGRFGYHAWLAWQTGQIKGEKMAKMVLAERARAKRELLGVETMILAVGAGANNPTKAGHAPKSLRNAIKILKDEQKQAKGVVNG
jgi:hypothetical protein